MNSCILMAKIVRAPQLRYTSDNQLAVTEMMVEFQESYGNSPPYTIKAVAWGNLAIDVEKQYKEGSQVILTGRLKMNLIERQEGFKEKIAELTISQIYPINVGTSGNNVVNLNSYKSEYDVNSSNDFEPDLEGNYEQSNNGVNPNDMDNIPF